MKHHRTRNETANRVAKAIRFAGFLETHLGVEKALQLARSADVDEWARIAEQAGERTPSAATIEAIVAVLDTRTAVTNVDVFAGMPA